MKDKEKIAGELEFAVRQYAVTTEYLMETLAKYQDEIPRNIYNALALLAHEINEEWD